MVINVYFYVFLDSVCLCVSPRASYIQRSEDNLQKSVFSIHHEDLEMELWSPGVAARLPSHLTSPYLFFDDFIHIIYNIT